MTQIRKLFGRQLRYFRRVRGFTQEELAEAAGLSVDFISLVERGISAPSFENIEILASVLGIEIPELFTEQTDSTFTASENKEA